MVILKITKYPKTNVNIIFFFSLKVYTMLHTSMTKSVTSIQIL